jgi:hypothetical protein
LCLFHCDFPGKARLSKEVVGTRQALGGTGLLAGLYEWNRFTPDRVAAGLYLVAAALSFGLLSAGVRRG